MTRTTAGRWSAVILTSNISQKDAVTSEYQFSSHSDVYGNHRAKGPGSFFGAAIAAVFNALFGLHGRTNFDDARKRQPRYSRNGGFGTAFCASRPASITIGLKASFMRLPRS